MRMQKKLFIILAALLFISIVADAQDAFDADYTTRLNATLKVSIYSPEALSGKIFLKTGEEFSLNVTAKCYNKSCETVDMRLRFCNGTYCENFFLLESKHNEIVSEEDGSISGQCKYVDRKVDRVKNTTTGELLSDEMLELLGNKFVCRNYVRLRANRHGNYTLIYEVSSTAAPTVYSEPILIFVSGCGDGICRDGEETVDVCPKDCCESDCSGVYDSICNSRCDGFNNCSMDSECAGKSPGQRWCQSDSSFVGCCSMGKNACEDEQFCSSGACVNCSRECDKRCESAACYKTDPDCGADGNASTPCCGNGLVESGEECEISVATSCLKGNCIGCKCLVTATTQQSTTTSSTSLGETTTQPEISTATTLEENITSSTALKKQDAGFDFMPVLYLLLALVGAALLFYGYKFYSSYSAKKEYSSLRLKQELLKRDKETVMKKYAEGRVSKEDASKQIFDLEEKISRLESRIQKDKEKL